MSTEKKKRKRILRFKGDRNIHTENDLQVKHPLVRAGMDGELSREDFEALGPVNLANDLGDDEQLKYWEDLAKGWAGSSMEETEISIDQSLKEEE